ncbi:hypothetical protein M9H77_06486 [Catharanthus roseus]|uniref:Uncharacterized protein n=1 Tax=Catharanthus roseus TaxID=4058 RepID=A0ACC0BSG1_CATRO|nr:hypothetical protein M9H77_06486 [Catharanthus roseus]
MYNLGWRNHSNFSWKQQGGEGQLGQQKYQQNKQRGMTTPGFQSQRYVPPHPPQSGNSIFEEKVLSALKGLEVKTQILDSHTQSIAKLETQIGQLANAISRRDEGRLPSYPIEKPRANYHEQAKAEITLRNGKEVDNKVGEPIQDNELNENETEEIDIETKIEKKVEKELASSSKSKTPEPSPMTSYEPKVPFPQALLLLSHLRKDNKMEDILETFKEVKINLPLLDAIKQVPAYAKFLKDICTFKRKTKSNVSKKIFLTEQVSSILQHNTPPKYKDLGVSTISCLIGVHKIDRALLDLGSSVNLIPYTVYEELRLGELQPTDMTLQLANRSIKIPKGRIDDVLFQIDKVVFPKDFVVLDMEPGRSSNNHIPVILGRPFLATANATINCRTGVMDVSVMNIRIILNIFKASS